jgi:ribosomal protein L32
MIHKQERQANIISLLTKCRKAGELKQATHICFLYELKVAFSQ